MSTVLFGCQRHPHLPNSPSDDSRVFAQIMMVTACPRAAEEDTESGITGAPMDPDSSHYSVRLKRSGTGPAGGGSVSGGAGTPSSGLSPGAISAVGAVAGAAPAAAVGPAVRSSQSPAGTKLRQARHFTFDFREPDTMEEFRSQRLQRKFREKMGAKSAKYELVAGFHLEEGVIISYHAFRTRIHFELTERRRKILARYYRQGQQEVLLYVDRSEFEYYTPVCCYQPPEQVTEMHTTGGSGSGGRSGGNSKRRGKGLASSCFAISGCAS